MWKQRIKILCYFFCLLDGVHLRLLLHKLVYAIFWRCHQSMLDKILDDRGYSTYEGADNARKNTAFPPVCKKCAKVCRAPEKGKSHEESYDSSWDFGALEGTRIPGPLIKSQMLYRLSYERIFKISTATQYCRIILPHLAAKSKRNAQILSRCRADGRS